jgi:hypothetical protein
MRLGGMLQQSLGGQHVMMDARREMALSGIDGKNDKFMRIFIMKIARRFD